MTQSTKKLFFKYAGFNVLGMLGISIYILADTFFIAQALGSKGIAALNISIPIYGFIFGIAIMLGLGGATRYSILVAQKKLDQAQTVFASTIKYGLIIGFIFLLVGLFASFWIAQLMGANEAIINDANTYIKTVMLFAPFFIINNVMIAFIRNDQNPRLAMIAMLIGSLLNILLDYLFLFPLALGIFGAALATAIAPIVSLTILSIHFVRPRRLLFITRLKGKMHSLKDIVTLGFPGLITEVSSSIVIITFNMIILRLSGNIGVAAYAIIANIALVVMAMFTGIAQGSQPLISHYHGLNDLTNLRKVKRYAILSAITLAMFTYLVMIVFNHEIVALFNKEQNHTLNKIATEGINIYFLGFIFASVNVILATYLSATEAVKKAFIISMLRGLIVIIPLVVILGILFGMNGVFAAFVIAEFLVFFVAIILTKTNQRIKPVLARQS